MKLTSMRILIIVIFNELFCFIYSVTLEFILVYVDNYLFSLFSERFHIICRLFINHFADFHSMIIYINLLYFQQPYWLKIT